MRCSLPSARSSSPDRRYCRKSRSHRILATSFSTAHRRSPSRRSPPAATGCWMRARSATTATPPALIAVRRAANSLAPARSAARRSGRIPVTRPKSAPERTPSARQTVPVRTGPPASHICSANAGACQSGSCVAGPRDCDDHVPCTQDSCDQSLGCVHVDGPQTGCLAAPKSKLLLAPATAGQAMLGWRWANGAALALGDLSDPTVDASYELCVYSGAVGHPDRPRHLPRRRAMVGRRREGVPIQAIRAQDGGPVAQRRRRQVVGSREGTRRRSGAGVSVHRTRHRAIAQGWLIALPGEPVPVAQAKRLDQAHREHAVTF